MSPVLLLLVLAQAPDAGEPEPHVIVVPVPMPAEAQPPPPQPAPVPPPVHPATPVPQPVEPIPPPMSPQPSPEPYVAPRPLAVDAGVLPPPPPTMAPQPVPVAPIPYSYGEYDAGTPVPPPPGLVFRAGIESGITSWPEGNPQDLWLFARPLLGLEAGDTFALDLGATFNLLVFDDPPVNRPKDFGGFLRHDDWDEPSDFGQIIRLLRVGKPDSKVWVRAGAVRLKTLGNGHTINRYSNQDAPNYHPAAGNGGFLLGPVRGEFFASDIFGARIFSGLLGLEFGRLLGSDPKWADRFWLTLEVAHDVGAAGGPVGPLGDRLKTPSASFLHLDFTLTMFKSQQAQVLLLVGAGSRIGNRADFGAELGLAADGDLGGFMLGGKIEVRKQAGGFRQGFFGPQYELSRFAGAGLSGIPMADQLLPDGFSFYAELRAGSRGFIVAEGAIEHFLWGRTDVDASLQAEFLDSRVVTSARFAAVALGVFPRYSISAEARVRIFKSFYVMGSGGTVFLPQLDGTLQRGVQVTAGVGVDFETGVNFN